MTIVWSRHSVRIERTTRSPMPRSLLRWAPQLLWRSFMAKNRKRC